MSTDHPTARPAPHEHSPGAMRIIDLVIAASAAACILAAVAGSILR
jgi:hypothetical protein